MTSSIMVMVLTIFLNNGMVTARALVSPGSDKAQCDKDAAAIIDQMEGKSFQIGDEKLTVTFIDHACFVQRKGQRA